jgi:cell division protein FtsB
MSRPRRPAAPPRPQRSVGHASGDRASARVSLDGLGVAGIHSRHLVAGAVAVVVAWVLFSFAGQVSEAASAADRTERLRAENAALTASVGDLERELGIVAGPAWVAQQARAYQLGAADERAFRLAPGAASLAPDAPGSPTVRLGAERERQLSPLEAWLELLFGPAPGS